MNDLSIIYLYGKYYIYTRTVIDGKVFVNIERLN